MYDKTALIPANRHAPLRPAPQRRRHMPAWLTQLLIIGSILVIVIGVLVGVVRSTTVDKATALAPFSAEVNAYQLTYAAHCQAGVPYVVRVGDTLASIAAHLGVPLAQLAKENGLSAGDTLISGQVLCPPPDNVIGPILVGTDSLEPCQSTNYWLPVISQWAVPPGCYGTVYAPNPANYPYRPTWGWCNWWPEETHPNLQGDAALHLPKHHTPIVGATVWFDGGEQGASSDGHWAELVAINPDGYWLLISEMNNTWRGAGWGRIDYRYVHMSQHVWFQY